MGCGRSSLTYYFTPDDRVPGQGLDASRDFARLRLSRETVDKFYDAFCKMDNTGTGRVGLDAFYAFFKLERSPFSDRVFSLFDDDVS